MYQILNGRADQFSGVVCAETDDLHGGGEGPKFEAAVDAWRRTYGFGKLKIWLDAHTEYGGRTLRQLKDFSIQISMTRDIEEVSKRTRQKSKYRVR